MCCRVQIISLLDFKMASDRAASAPDLGLPPVDDRIGQISQLVKHDHELNEKLLPGLAHLLDDYLDPEVPVTTEDFTRRLLKVFRRSTDNTYEDLLKGYSHNEQAALEAFVKGQPASEVGHGLKYAPSIAARQELGHLQQVPLIGSLQHELRKVKEEIREIFGGEPKEVPMTMHGMKKTDIGILEDKAALEVNTCPIVFGGEIFLRRLANCWH